MKNLILSLIILFTGVAFAQTSNTGIKSPVPGDTLANTKLQYDTISSVYAAANMKVPSCNNLSIVNSKVLKQPSNGNWQEEWVVNACGKKVFVPITFILDYSGATYMISPKEVHF